jgi:hypothetical protein
VSGSRGDRSEGGRQQREEHLVGGGYDVFVTETGDRKEPVLGWITDVIIADSEPDPTRSTPDTPAD